MKTIQEMVEVMQAYERGEKIEINNPNDGKGWTETSCPMWNWGCVDYRVQPKEYVPFETAEEFFAAQRVHGINIVKIGGTLRLLGFISYKNKVMITDTLYKYMGIVTFDELFYYYAFVDDTPCGKEVEE